MLGMFQTATPCFAGNAAILTEQLILGSSQSHTGARNDVTGNGPVGSEMPFNVVVRGNYDNTKNYPGGLTVCDQSNPTDRIAMVYDVTGARGIIDSSNAGVGGTTLALNPLGGGAVTVGGKLSPAATTARASMNLATGTAPTSPVDGDIWREDNTNTGLKIRVNGVTKQYHLYKGEPNGTMEAHRTPLPPGEGINGNTLRSIALPAGQSELSFPSRSTSIPTLSRTGRTERCLVGGYLRLRRPQR